MKKYSTWVPVLKIFSVVSVAAISIYVSFSIMTYENPYEKLKSRITIENNKITIKDFAIKIYPSNGHEIALRAEKFQTDLRLVDKQSFFNVHTSIK